MNKKRRFNKAIEKSTVRRTSYPSSVVPVQGRSPSALIDWLRRVTGGGLERLSAPVCQAVHDRRLAQDCQKFAGDRYSLKVDSECGLVEFLQ